MKLKQFIFAFVAVLLCSVSSTFAQVAKIGETDYATLSAAAGAVENGETIVLTANCSGSFTIKQVEGKSFTIHGNGKTFSGTITINGNGRSNGDETLTFTNVVFDAANSIIGSSNAHNVIFDTCTFKTSSGYHISPGPNYNWKFLNCKVTGTGALWQAASATSNLYVEEFVSENSGNVFKIDYCSPNGVTATFKNVEIKSGVVGFYISNRNSGSIIFENVTANCQYPIYVWDRGTGIDTPLAFDGKNEFASTAGQPWLTNGSAATIDADAHIVTEKGLKVYGSLADAAEDAKLGETIVLLKNTDETVELPVGVKLDKNGFTAENVKENSNQIESSGTWGGIDWTLYQDGLLVIAPTKGEPVPDKNAPTKRTYEVGEWRETVIYKSNGSASAIGGAPYNMNAVKKLIIEEGVTKIGSFTCQFPNLTGEVVIPSTVTYFGQEAFHKAPMTSLVFAAGGTESLCIANGVFKKTLIEEVSLPGDRPSIEIHHWAFGGCPNLKRAHLTANITKVWGGEHVDYFDNFNSQTNVTWANSSMLFTGCTLLETVTFEDETIRDLFFAHDNGVNSYKEGAYNGDYIQAYIGLTAYNTLQAAINAANEGDVITMVKSVDNTFAPTEPIVVNKAVTINGNGKTFTSKAEDCAFKVTAQGAKIENLKISAPNAAVDILTEGATLVKLADSYYPTVAAAIADAEENAELTLLAGTYNEDIDINKNVTLKGVMNEAAPVALDDTESQNSGMTVYTGTMTIGEADVTIQNIDFVGKLVLANGATVKAAEGLTVTTNVEGYEVAYENGAYSVVEKKNDVAKIGETGYASLAAAFAAANVEGNHTITLLADNAEVFEFAQVAGANITVDGDDKTFTGKITLNAGAGNLTFTDMTLTPSNADAKSIVLNAATAPNVTIDGCTMKNTGTKGAIVWGQASATSNKVVIKNSTASHLQYLVGTNQSGCEDVTVENVTATDMAYLIRPMKATKVTVKDVKYSGLTFIHVKNSKESVLALENVEVTTNGYLPIAMMTPDSGTAAAKYTITLNGENTANGAAMTKANEAAWFERKDESNPYEIKDLNPKVAKIDETGYASLAAAINAAQAGQTITLVAAVTEDVTVNKNVTIDGANNTYTGQMKLTANATIKNVNFDGKGNYSEKYAIVTDDAYIVNVADCTAKSYMGFLNIASNNDATTVKNVTVSEVAYGIKVDYSNDVTIENADITASSAAVLNSNYGNKTITIKDCELNILGTWTRNSTIKTNYLFAGANSIGKFIIDAAIDNFKLAAGATLTAPNDIVATTDVEGYEVTYENGAYSVVEQKNYVAKIGTKGYETFVDAYVAAKGGDTIELLADVTVPNVTDSKINYNYETAMFEIRKAITIDGNGHKMTADAATATNKKHTLHIHTSGVQLKNVIIDNVGKTKNVNVYCAQNVIFDNVQIINASKGSAALTINNSTVITKTAFAALGNSTAIELGIGKNITAQNLELVVEEGTVFDLGGKSVTLTNNTAKVTTAGNAVDANGNPYFAAYDTSKLYTVAQLKSKAGSLLSSTFSNGLTFVADVALDFDLKVKGTLNLNGHHITIADGKTLTAGGNLTINGNGKLGVKAINKSWYTITIEDGAYGIDVTQYCRQGYASLPDLNGYYVVGAKPTATIENLGSKIIDAEGYYVHNLMGSGDNKEAMPLQFVMQYTADQTAEEVAVSPYKEWYADFVLSFTGLSNGSFVADEETYLAGFYGETEKWEDIWAKVGITGMEITEGTRYPVMSGVGMPQDYNYICAGVQEFLCAMNISSDIVAANPDLKVTLELCLVDNSNQDAAFNALQNGSDKCNVIAVKEFTAENFKSPVVNEGTWGGIDWTLRYDGSLTIAPTKGTPTTDNSGKWTYEVGQWPEAVRYNAKGEAAEIALWPYDLLAVKSLVIEEGVTSIGSFAARGFKNLTGEVVIPSTVTYIGQEAFQFSTMTKVTFAEGGTEPLCIAQGAFKNTIIEEIALPADRPSIHLHAWVFQNCHYLKNVTLPANVRGVTGTNHVDYNHNANAQTGGNAGSCAIFADTKALETITFGSEDVKNLYFSKERGNERIVATVGLTSYSNLATATEIVNENGGTITMNNNATLAATWTIPAGKEVTLDLNGKTVSMNTAEAAVAALIKNNGTLTIESSVDGGKLSFLATAPSADNAYASNTISNYGTLTINAGTVENLSTGGACYALDNYAGSTANINGGKLTAKKTAVRIFNWTNGEANAAELNVVGGEIISNDGYGININAGNAPYVALNISGGTITTNDTDYNLAVYVVNKNSAENFTANISSGTFNGNLALNGVTSTTMAEGNVSVTGGTFDGVICYGEPANGFVAGGTFKSPVAAAYCAEGYVCKESESEGYYDVVFDPTYGKVAMIGETYYETLAAAITAANAGDTITFIADITEDVTVSKAVAIDGAGKNYTGTMTVNNVAATIENVAFVKGQVYKNKNTGTSAVVNIKGCTFDGQGMNAYAVNLGGTSKIVLENVTAKDYGYGLLQVPSSCASLEIKNVEVSGCYYGFKVDYANAVSMENVKVADGVTIGIYDSNYGDKTYTIKDSEISSISIWERDAAKTTTFKFEGDNVLTKPSASQYAKYALAAGATLTAPEGLTVTTNVEHCIVDYTDGVYSVIPDPMYIAELTLVDGQFENYADYALKTVGKFTYKRTIAAAWQAIYLPFPVEVDVLAEQGFEIAYINGIRRTDNDEDGKFDNDGKFTMDFIMIHGGKGNTDGSGKILKANYPYFIRPADGAETDLVIEFEDFVLPEAVEMDYTCSTFTEEFKITGVVADTYINSTPTAGLFGLTKKGEWTCITKGATMRPFRFYMTVTSRDGNESLLTGASFNIVVRGEERPDGTTLIYDVEADREENDMIFDLQGRRVLETEKGGIYIKNGKKFIAQ